MKPLVLLALSLVGVSARCAEPLGAGRVDELRAQIRETFFIPDPLPALEAKTHRRFRPAPGVAGEALTYSTQFGLRVPAILYLPDPLPVGGVPSPRASAKQAEGTSTTKIPAFVVVNGHGGDKYAWYAYYTGIAFARAGMAVLTFDPAGEGERSVSRKSGTREHDKLQGDAVMARRLEGLLVGDVMQAVSYLRSRAEIDPQRIGAGGYSLGSFVLALAGAVEPRLHACVLVGGGNLDGPGGYWDASKKMCQGWPYASLAFLGDRPAVIYALHAARGPLLIWNGRADTVVNMPNTQEPFFDDLRARVVAWRGGREAGVFTYGFTEGGSHRPYWLTRPAVLWLEQQLDFPGWTAESIRAARETHISEWAARTRMPMDKLYATEEREGGTTAVGDGAPAIEREQLSVFTAAEWEKEKSRLTFDVWTEKARAAGK